MKTTKINQFDRTNLRMIREMIDQELADLGERLGVSIKAGSASFTSNNATYKLQIATISEEGEICTKEAEDFKLYCFRWGLAPDDLGREFNFRGNTYTITGAKPRSYQYPILATRGYDGKSFKFAVDQIKSMLQD